jgi:hypothetical protein
MRESYISLVGFMVSTPIDTFYLDAAEGCGLTAFGLQGEMFCFQNSTLVHTRTGKTVAADIAQRLEIEDYRYDIRITAAAAAGADTLWVAFSFSGVCGPDVDAGTSDQCGAIELITVSLASVSISPASWGKQFPWTGLVGRITAMSYLAPSQQLFLVIDRTSVKMYRVAFYDSNTQVDARGDDAVVDYYESRDIIRDVAACGGAVYAIMMAQQTQLARLSPGSAASAAPLPPQATRLLCVAASHSDVLIVMTSDNKWMQVDLINNIVGTQAPGAAVAFSMGILHVLEYSHSALNVFAVTPCPRDHFVHALSGCVPMPCVLACGPNSTRGASARGASATTGCQCLPGFFLPLLPSSSSSFLPPHQGCAPCEANHVCPGGGAPPQRCDATTEVVRDNQCICAPGYYRYDSCLPCPSNHWCYREKVVPCLWRQESNSRSSSPLDCSCPPRTHGLQCLPCDADADCTERQPQAVDVWIFDRAADAAIFAATPGAAASADDHVVAAPASAPPGLSERLHPSRTVRTRQMVPCGRNAAWLFDTCSCVAGYTVVPTSSPSTSPHCLPCLNGTARSLLQQLCTPCPNGSSAPYLGMEACIVDAALTQQAVTPFCILLTTLIGASLVFFGVLMGALY